ncbi:MAG: thioesterase [Minwuia thermotolerans]|nr:MAG: thioesterase [Minwuia thermotolerans]
MQPLKPLRDDFEVVTRDFLSRMPATATLGLVVRAFGPGTSEIEMPVTAALTFDGTHVQGGLVGALLDIAGGTAALTLTPEGQAVRTLGFETHHLGPAGGERLVARGTVIKPGRNQALSRVDVHAVDGARQTLCATGLVTSCWVPLPA